MIASLILFDVSSNLYQSYHPFIEIFRCIKDDENNRIEMMMILGDEGDYPIADEVEDHIIELVVWNNDVLTPLLNRFYVAPVNIRVDGEVKNGQTIIRYEGTVTNEELLN